MGADGKDAPLTGSKKNFKSKSAMKDTLLYVMPALEWLPDYKAAWLQADIAGGMTLGCILVAQSLAHASLSNVNLINGPYSCILPPATYAVFGTCVHSSVGTGGLVALLTGEQLIQYTMPPNSGYADDLSYRTHVGAILTAEVGLMMALMGICQLAFLVRFLSRPALSGFITASAVLIILSQMAGALGLPPVHQKAGMLNILYDHFLYLQRNIQASIPTMCLSAVALVYLLNGKKLKKVRFLKPLGEFKELILLVLSAVFCWLWNGSRGKSQHIEVIGTVPSGLPALDFPIKSQEDLELAHELLPGAGLIALVVFLSSFAGAKKFAMMDGYQVRAFNELVALGLANLSGAFMGAVPTQIGLSRMGIAHGAGVKSQLGANVFVAVVVAMAVQFCSSALYEVPRCVLNCIIISGASHLTEFEQAKILWGYFSEGTKYDFKARLDIVTWLVGFLCTTYLGAFKGILIAVFISLMLILYQVVNPSMNELGYQADTDLSTEQSPKARMRARKWVGYRKRNNQKVTLTESPKEVLTEQGILVYRMEGPLFYANLEYMQEWVEDKLVTNQEEADEEEKYHTIILSAASMPWLDSTAVMGLQQMVKSYRAQNINFFVAQTFGNAGRVLADKLDRDESVYPTKELQDLVTRCSSIDDFVRAARRLRCTEEDRNLTRTRSTGVRRYSRVCRDEIDVRCECERL